MKQFWREEKKNQDDWCKIAFPISCCVCPKISICASPCSLQQSLIYPLLSENCLSLSTNVVTFSGLGKSWKWKVREMNLCGWVCARLFLSDRPGGCSHHWLPLHLAFRILFLHLLSRYTFIHFVSLVLRVK